MSRSSRELIDFADKRIREVQRKMNHAQFKQTTVFHGTLETGLMPALQSLQMYVDQWLLDATFPWQRHWLPHIVDLTSEDTATAAASTTASSATASGTCSPGTSGKRADDDAAYATERMIDFMERAEAALASGVAAGRGTVKQLELCVLYHVTMLLQKVLGSQRAAIARDAPDGADHGRSEAQVPMDHVPPPSGGAVEARDAPAVASTGPAARHPSPPKQPRPSRPRTTPGSAATRHAGERDESPRRTVGGVEYVRVNMGIANKVCRPHSARELGAKKGADGRVQRMVGALEREAPRVNARDGPVLEPPLATSRLRQSMPTAENENGGETPRPWDDAARTDGAAAAADADAAPVYHAPPSIRKPTATTAAQVVASRATRQSVAAKREDASFVVPDSTRMIQSPIRGTVTVGAAAVAAAAASPARAGDASKRSTTPRVGVASVPTRMWGVRLHGEGQESKQMSGRVASTRWTLVSHDANVAGGVAQHTQTVCVSSAATRRHPCDPVGGPARIRGASWSSNHDAAWVAPEMKEPT
uniref:Uncharacterized protein n=1 Tax=Neobodo designis TaxID=312471 RepID=A0A7S1MJG9_NEODS|mmetsp:Transcript_41815/g.129194  ORF Transcript_41815/g.129194 Transcript_41815/m.129194 type:complete len:533 (+) Transcript_41815:41-1639(+)